MMFFPANGYTTETLRVVRRREIEQLIKVPYLAERTKLIHGLDIWRQERVILLVLTHNKT